MPARLCLARVPHEIHAPSAEIIMVPLNRRDLLTRAAATFGVALVAPGRSQAAAQETHLVAAPSTVSLVGDGQPETEVWAYNGQVPGPVLRFRQGQRARIVVENRLPQETTVHWHGLRVPNAMDGVPHVTQKPIRPGERFVYEFELKDAGTFWYHPHARSAEQLERGLAGVLIVEEPRPITVDRDIVWVIDDWRLSPQAAVVDDFDNFHDASHAGRLGNSVTINGRVPDGFATRAGERVRLRLANVCNARAVALAFEGHAPLVVALDGHPVVPHPPEGGRVVLGPGMRADVILDMTGAPRGRYPVTDTFYRNAAYRLVDLAYGPEPALRNASLPAPEMLPDNPVPAPDLLRAERHVIELGGGMMDPRVMQAMREGRRDVLADVRERMRQGHVWTINGQSVMGHEHAPLLTLARGRSYIFEVRNDTAWHHPMHLHGMAFDVLSRNGTAAQRRERRDTVMLAPGERAEIAFVADEPGGWMLHCHILEHQGSGMMGTIRVV